MPEVSFSLSLNVRVRTGSAATGSGSFQWFIRPASLNHLSIKIFTLSVLNIFDALRQLFFIPQISLAAAMSPGTAITRPASSFSHGFGSTGF
jgi:hypothetical protein